jgi:hypothetical protein
VNAQFQGDTFDPVLDGPRLNTQLERVLMLMLDNRYRTLAAIQRIVGGSEAGISARLRDLRKPQNGSYTIERQRVKDSGLWMYRLAPPIQMELGKLVAAPQSHNSKPPVDESEKDRHIREVHSKSEYKRLTALGVECVVKSAAETKGDAG